MHKRRGILNAIGEQLKSVGYFAVVRNQRFEPQKTAYPAVMFYASGEVVETLNLHYQPHPQDRVLTVSVVVLLRAGVDLEKIEHDIDLATYKVETAINDGIDGVDSVVLESVEFSPDDTDGEISRAVMAYAVGYQTTELDPS